MVCAWAPGLAIIPAAVNSGLHYPFLVLVSLTPISISWSKTSSQKGPDSGLMASCYRVALLQSEWEKQKQGPGCEH